MIPEYIFGSLNLLLLVITIYFLFKILSLSFRMLGSHYELRTYREVRKLRIDLQRFIATLKDMEKPT